MWLARIALRSAGLAAAIAIALACIAPVAWGESVPAASPAVAEGDWQDPEAWRRLRIGMTRAQVVALLGEPGKITSYYAFERWEYPDALGERVNFDERGRLASWGPFAR